MSGGIYYSMQVIYQDEVEREHSGRADIMDIDICTGRISGCVEGKYNGRIGVRRDGI